MIEIRSLTNKTRGFYALMGPHLARREIAAALGSPVWDDDGLEWFIAVDGREVVGFCALMQRDGRADLRSSYVMPGRRGRGIYRQLFAARLAAIRAPCRARSTVRKEAVPVFREHGFKEARRRGSYHVMERTFK